MKYFGVGADQLMGKSIDWVKTWNSEWEKWQTEKLEKTSCRLNSARSAILKFANSALFTMFAAILWGSYLVFTEIIRVKAVVAVFGILEINNNYVFVAASATAATIASFCFSYARTLRGYPGSSAA